MDKSFEDQIKYKLIKDVEPLPDSYTERISTLIEQLQESKAERTIKFNIKYAAIILGLFVLGASGTNAAVHVYQQYLSSMSQTEKEQLNKKTQRLLEELDHFSRDLSKEERGKIESLRKKYENDGMFPEEKIIEIDHKDEVMKGELVYCYENSTFYLPDEELTDEDILKIIDFWERRDYAVKEKNKGERGLIKEQKISQEEAVRIAKNILQKLYKLEMENAESIVEFDPAEVSDEEAIPSYLISFTGQALSCDAIVEIDAKEGIVKRVAIDDKSKEECVSGIKVDEDRCRKCLNEIYSFLSVLGEKDYVDEIRLIYKYRKDGTLNRGNIKYLVKLNDESAYVFLYSVNTQTIYQFYEMTTYKDVLKQEKDNAKIQKQSGIMTKNKVIMK